ncbi:DNA repair protein rad10 [Lindgomyces ingoldianus]|uniref:DNA repair protein rad10 n=1 Tax=Lindgomyces ingoldianus TaxID=673940 RepID=A0ACB6QZ25_9PLEO|nr:DNA repair protein rad10 [Lindgomyces ingoldianus]KAF2472151.1 DNA repair protein rad10 [Lindgomyces ingoldianus]
MDEAGPLKVQQPKPQALPSRSGPSSILVSPRQKGNPILNGVRTVAWEYSDIPADYVLGATTCALFLSLKYHRLHPEYIYNRIRDLRGQYSLRILLTMVDIENHEDSLRELSKTSLINNVTLMLCWSAQEAGRYLELFKTFEHAAPTSIRAQQSTSYSDKLVEFITVPRSINKTDAIGLVSNFGSIRTALNAGPEEVGLIAGWGEKKVQRWCNAAREPFRIKKAGKRGVGGNDSRATMSRDVSRADGEDSTANELDPSVAARLGIGNAPIDLEMNRPAHPITAEAGADRRPETQVAEEAPAWGEDEDEEAMREAGSGAVQMDKPRSTASSSGKQKAGDAELSEGIMAALNRLRQQ